MKGIKALAGSCLCVVLCGSTIARAVVSCRIAHMETLSLSLSLSLSCTFPTLVDKSSEQTNLINQIFSIRAINAQDLCADGSGSEKQKKAKLKNISTAKEIAGKQKDAKTEKPSAAEERIRKLIETVKEERPATKEEIVAEEKLMQEITGLIIEETMTKIGYEFYEYFFLLWKPPQTVLKYYNIVITERASPMWGSLVEVKIGETTVWSRMLKPRSEEIEESAKQAIEATKNYLQDYEKYQLKTIDMMGTGI